MLIAGEVRVPIAGLFVGQSHRFEAVDERDNLLGQYLAKLGSANRTTNGESAELDQ